MSGLHLLLERLGATSWYDNQMRDLTALGMASGVRGSDVFVLFLTRGVFARPFVRYELLEAVRTDKMVLLLHEENEQRGAFKFDARSGVPVEVQPVTCALLRGIQSLPWRRLRHEQRSLIDEIVRRRSAGEIRTFSAACPDVGAHEIQLAAERAHADVTVTAAANVQAVSAPTAAASGVHARATPQTSDAGGSSCALS
jgi:hypothetical protein